MLNTIANKIYLFFNRKKYKKAVKYANSLRASTFKKYYVISLKGEFRVFSKQRLKELHNLGVFKRGVKFREIEKMVLYSTH